MAGEIAQGFYQVDGSGNVLQNTSGSPVEIREDGPILFANFFNAGRITATAGRVYTARVECEAAINGCTPVRFTVDIGGVPTDGSPRATSVAGYPELIVAGTKFGVPQETIGTFNASRVISNTGKPYVSMTTATQLTGFPQFTNQIPPIYMAIDIDEFNHVGSERDVMIETWFHDTKFQTTPTNDDIWGSLDNVIGESNEAGPNTIVIEGLTRRQHNNILLEQMVHWGPIGGQDSVTTQQDSAQGTQNPAQFYCNTIENLGGWKWEIWYGNNSHGPLVVYNRIGVANCDPCSTNLTTEGQQVVPYEQILQYTVNNLAADLIACNAQANQAWANPASPLYPFTAMLEDNRMAMSGIEVGHEPYYNPSNDLPYGMVINSLDLQVSGRQLGTCEVSGCALPVTFQAGTLLSCTLPVIFSAFCSLPVLFAPDLINQGAVDCVTCPQSQETPRELIPFGSQDRTFSPEIYNAFPAGTTITINGASVVGLSGDVSHDNVRATYRAPGALIACDAECGKLQIQYSYQCPDGVLIEGCSVDIEVCSFPEHNPLPDEQIIRSTGAEIIINSNDPVALQPILEPIQPPPVGELRWNGSGWTWDYPDGLTGVFQIIVPSSPNGSKGAYSERCVTVCLTPVRDLNLGDKACYSVLAVKDKTSGLYVPTIRTLTASLSLDFTGVDAETDFETGLQCYADVQEPGKWSSSVTGELLCTNPFNGGTSVDVMMIKDARYGDPPRFVGTARVLDISTSFGGNDTKQITINLSGHGQWYMANWLT